MTRITHLAIAGLAVAVLATSASAVLIPVTDYNWTQMGDGVTVSAGNPSNPIQTTGGGITGYGNFGYLRWGGYTWIPHNTLTGSGAGDWWAGIDYGSPREVTQVRTQFWNGNSSSVRRFTVEGSADGVNFSSIGSHDYGSFKTNNRITATVDVTDGNYQALRIRLNGTDSQPGDPDYTDANYGIYGGPGIFAIDAIGDGSLEEHLVNWASGPTFGTTVSNNGLNFNGTAFNNGSLLQNGAVRTGDTAPWEAGDYAEIDLKTERLISRAIVRWEYNWGAEGYSLEYSTDGSTFLPMTGVSAPIVHGGRNGALEYTFDPVTARYVRMVDATGNASHYIFNQMMLYSPEAPPAPACAIPEPAALALLGLGGLALRRRQRA